MLTYICDKLGIAVPEFYFESNPYPDSYTIGDKNPMIILTTGLIETLPTELIPTVLAHECGHIICGHVLYTTLAYLVIKRGIISGISALVSTPLEMGFYYWMKASEYSADKAAAVIDGTSDKLVDLCIHLAGYSRDFPFKPDRMAFISQADDYDEELADSKINKTFDNLNLKRKDHPLCAVRARQCYKMANTEEFSYLCRYIEEESKGITKHDHIPVPCIPEDFEVKPFDILVEELKEIGFTNIAESMIISSEPAGKERKIVAVKFGNSRDYDAGDLFDKNDTCVISYLASETDVKQADMENMITVPHGSSKLFNTANGLDSDSIRAICEGSNGCIYVGTALSFSKITPDGVVKTYNEWKNVVHVQSLVSFDDGRILIASNMGLTFLRDGRPELLLSDSDGLNNRYILSMTERDDGAVLAASDGDGIYIIKNDKVAGHIGAEEGLETAVILRIVPCKGGYLYVSSNGLYYDDGGKVRRLKNFPYSNNYDILISDSGSCYITSSAGLFIVSEEKLIEDKQYACTLLNESWGLNTTFTANSRNIMDGGYLCLCCTDGVRMISEDNYGTDRGEYQMHLKSIEADGKALDQTDGKWVIPSKTRRIVLNISVNNFSLSNPRIHYYLDGSKDDGITCYQNEITPLAFTNLAYGKYDLHVCVIDDLTGEVINEKVIPIEKEAAMYEYWYFKLYVMFVMMQLMMYVIFVMLSFKRRNQRIADTFKKYVAPQVVEEITKNGAKDISLSSDSRDAAVLFVDIRGFTTMSEKLPPEQVVLILNSYFELTTNAIFNNGGTLDKFIGDATMAVFNAPFDLDDYVYKALMTAVEIVNGGAELEKKFLETYDLSVGFGVGINCGNAVVGNIGCSIRMDYTAIGDTVNTAARLESKAQKGQILISQNVYDRVKDRVEVESIGDLSLKGKSKDVHVYSLKELK